MARKEEKLSTEKQFNAANNINRLISEEGINRKDFIEAMAYSDGYVSKFLAGKTDVTWGFLYKASQYLGFSLDYLLTDHEQLLTDEASIVDFLENIYTACKADEIPWECILDDYITDEEEALRLCGPIIRGIDYILDDNFSCYPPHIAKRLEEILEESLEQGKGRNDGSIFPIAWIGDLSVGKGITINGVTYTEVWISGDIYHAKLNDIDAEIYLYKCRYFSADKESILPGVIECYLQAGESRHFLCSSEQGDEYFKHRLRDLYSLARKKCDGKLLNNEARNLIDQFNKAKGARDGKKTTD